MCAIRIKYMNKITDNKYFIWALNNVAYALLALSFYWGTMLAIFSFQEFFRTFRISPNFFQAVYGIFGLVAWLNAGHYFKKIRRVGVILLWKNYYNKEKNKIILTIVLTSIFVTVLELFKRGLNLSGIGLTIMNLLALPWAFGSSVIFIIDLNVRRYVPILEPINELGWLLSLAFELVLFNYISRIVFWRPKRSKKNNEKNTQTKTNPTT